MSAAHLKILLALIAAEIVSGFEATMVLAGMLQWTRIYGDPIAAGWLVSAYFLVAGAAAALIGRLGDLYGRKQMLVLTIAVCVCGSVLSASTSNLNLIIVGRAIQGVAGGIIPLAFGIARESLPPKSVPFAVGLIIGTAGLATSLGLLSGGLVTDHFGPHVIFYVSSVVGLIALGIVIFAIPPSKRNSSGGRLDILGGVLFAPGLAALLLALSNLRTWSQMELLTSTAVGLLLLTLWVVHELRHPEPLIDVRLFANRNILFANIGMICLALGAFQISQLSSMLLQQSPSTGAGLGMSASFIGMIKVPSLIITVSAASFAGWLSGRLERGGRLPMMAGLTLVAISLLFGAAEHDTLFAAVATFIAVTTGVGVAHAAISAIVVANAPADRVSEASGVAVVLRAMAQAVGAQVLAVLLATSVTSGAHGTFPTDAAYSSVYWFMAAAAAIGILTAIPIGASRGGAHPKRPVDREGIPLAK